MGNGYFLFTYPRRPYRLCHTPFSGRGPYYHYSCLSFRILRCKRSRAICIKPWDIDGSFFRRSIWPLHPDLCYHFYYTQIRFPPSGPFLDWDAGRRYINGGFHKGRFDDPFPPFVLSWGYFFILWFFYSYLFNHTFRSRRTVLLLFI